MKKNLFLFAFILLVNVFTINNTVFAQKVSKNNKRIAKELCECTKNALKEYPPLFTQMLIDYAEFGKEKAEEKLKTKMMALSPEEQEAFAKDIQEKPMEQIMEKYCGETKKLMKKYKIDNTSRIEWEKIINFMKKDGKCKEVYSLMSMSLKFFNN